MDTRDADPLLPPHTPEDTPTPEGHGGRCGCCTSIGRVLRGVTIEPILFLYVVAAVMSGTITTNLLLDKECKEMEYPEEVCRNLSSHPSLEADVQRRVTVTMMYYSLITSLPSVLFALFLGSWSDRHGRKLPMILPLVGNLVSSVIYVVNAYLMSLPSAYILFCGLPIALTGGMTTLLMACFSYVSDITKLRARTTRIAFVDLGFSLGSPIGMLLGDLLNYYVGYLGIYGTGASLYLVATLYAALRVRDTKGGPEASVPGNASRRRRMCEDLFDTENVRSSFETAFKRRPDKGRTKVLLLFGTMCLMVAEFGGLGMDYLYTKRMFGWTYNQYVQLSVSRLLIQLAVVSVVLPVLSYRLQVGDSVLVLVGCGSKILGAVSMALAPQPWLLYLSAVISSLGVLPIVITRSLISKVVPPEELGRIFSVLASFEAVIPLASGPLYTAVYNSSLKAFPGAFFFLSAALYLLATSFFVWVFFHRSTTTTITTTITTTTTTPPINHIHADEIPDLET